MSVLRVYERSPYVAMRMIPAILGIATIPLSYITLRGLDCRATTALLASLLITFENGMITQSRHILLDSPLIFFTALTVFTWTGFCNEDKHEPFTERWWVWLTLTGLSLGAVVSSKWVGLFTIATVGLGTLKQLWTLLGDVRVPPKLFIKHFWTRAVCLILIPVLFYMAMFEIHFLVLENSGEGDGFMSAEFQHTLGGHSMEDTYAGWRYFLYLEQRMLTALFRCRYWLSDHVAPCEHTRRLSPLACTQLPRRKSTYARIFLITFAQRLISPSTILNLRTTSYPLPPSRPKQRLAHRQCDPGRHSMEGLGIA